jgi:esterase/lipase
MKRAQRQFRQPWHKAAYFLCATGLALVMALSPAAAQDIRGMEVCTAEKQMERRTACLQANVEFLQQTLNKLAHDTQEKSAAADRDLAAARAEIAALKSAMEKLNGELKQMKVKPEPETKK